MHILGPIYLQNMIGKVLPFFLKCLSPLSLNRKNDGYAHLEKPTDRTYLENTLNKNTLGETLGIEITEVGENYIEGKNAG